MKIIQFLWVLAVLVSCSGNSDEPSSPALTLSLKSDRKAVLANGEDKAVLSVVDGEGNAITQKCAFFVNGATLAVPEFRTSVAGEYKLKATCEGVESNVVTVAAVEKEELVVTADKKSFIADGVDGIALKLATNLGEDLTAQATFYVGEEPFEGSFFTTDEPGDYVISVEHDGFRFDKTLPVTAVAAAADGSFTGRVLLEDYTSVHCVNCPRVIGKLEQLVGEHPRLIVAALHTDGMGSDPMTKKPEITDLIDLVGKSFGLPFVRVNRSNDWDENEASLLPFLNAKANLGIALKSEIAGSQLKLEATMMSKKTFMGARCVAMLLEDGYVYAQSGGGASFVHRRVLREITSARGDAMDIPAGRPAGKSLVLPWKSFYNAENCMAVFFIVSESGSVLNVHEVRPGEQIGY